MDEAELPYETYWILTAHVCCYVGVHVLLTVCCLNTNSSIDSLANYFLNVCVNFQFLARRNVDGHGEMKDDNPGLKQVFKI